MREEYETPSEYFDKALEIFLEEYTIEVKPKQGEQ